MTKSDYKETFMLNGEELPCPSESYKYSLCISGLDVNSFSFRTKEELNMVEQAINKLLVNSPIKYNM